MLAALLRHHLDAAHRVTSAGVAAASDQPASPQAIACMAERGIDLQVHRSRSVDLSEAQRADLILCMSPSHARALLQAGVASNKLKIAQADQGGVPDPFGGDLDDYRRCANSLQAEVEQLVRRIQNV